MIDLISALATIAICIAFIYAAINVVYPLGQFNITNRKRGLLLLFTVSLPLANLSMIAPNAPTDDKIGGLLVIAVFITIPLAIYLTLRDKPSAKAPVIAAHRDPAPAIGTSFPYQVSVKGVYYRQEDAIAFMALAHKTVRLEKEPDNPYDSRAIKVIGIGVNDGVRQEHHIGYIPRQHSIALYNIENPWSATASYDPENDIYFEPDIDEFELQIFLHISGISRRDYRRLVRQAYDLDR